MSYTMREKIGVAFLLACLGALLVLFFVHQAQVDLERQRAIVASLEQKAAAFGTGHIYAIAVHKRMMGEWRSVLLENKSGKRIEAGVVFGQQPREGDQWNLTVRSEGQMAMIVLAELKQSVVAALP